MLGIKTVLFDLDSTLTNPHFSLDAAHRAVVKRLWEYLGKHGIVMNESAVRSKLDAFDDRMNMETRYNRDEWWPVLLAELGLRHCVPNRIINELTQLYWTAYSNIYTPYPDAEPTLNYLKMKGYKLGLITDTDGKPGMKGERLKHLPFIGSFNVIVIGGDDTTRTKPDPEPFLLAVSKLKLDVDECVMVGDKPFTDISGAKAAGMRTILVKRREWGVEESADLTINSLSELKQIL